MDEAVSVVGDNIARATAAGIHAARMAPFVHCEPQARWAVRAYLLEAATERAGLLLAEFETRWAELDRSTR